MKCLIVVPTSGYNTDLVRQEMLESSVDFKEISLYGKRLNIDPGIVYLAEKGWSR